MPLRNVFTGKRLIVFFILIVSILVRVYHLQKAGAGLFPDSTQYLSMATNLIYLNKLESFGAHFPDIMRPILYPIFVSTFYFVSGDIMLSAILVSIIAGVLSVVVLYYIGAQLLNKTAGAIAGMVAAINPTLTAISTYCLTDALAILFLLLSYLFGFRVIKTGRARDALAVGFFLALGFLTRQIVEIHIYSFFLLLTLVLLLRKSYSNLIKRGILIIAVMVIVWSPYVYYVYKQTGEITLNTGKAYLGVKEAVLRHKIEDGFYEKLIALERPNEFWRTKLEWEILYRSLNDRNDGLLSFDYYFNKAEKKKMNSFRPLFTWEKMQKVLGNTCDLLKLIRYSFGPLMIFGLVGIYILIRRKQYLIQCCIVTAIAADILFILRGHLEERYAANILMFFAILVGLGLCSFFNWMRGLERGRLRKIVFGSVAVIIIVFSVLCIPGKYGKSIISLKHGNAVLGRVRDEFKKIVGQNAKISARLPTFVFVLRGEFVPFPLAEFTDTLQYLEKKGVEYLLLDPIVVEREPFFIPAEIERTPKWKLEKSVMINKSRWYLYKKVGVEISLNQILDRSGFGANLSRVRSEFN